MLRLISATPSPYARKVRIVLHEKSLTFELITEVPWNRDASAPRFNPLGKIPVLLLDDGSSLYESSFIVEYLELSHPNPKLVPDAMPLRLQHRRIEVLADGLCDALVLILIERSREPLRQSELWIDRQRGKAERALAEIARLISPDTDFATGDVFGLADIALGCALGYLDLRFAQIDWRTQHRHLLPLYERLSSRESFKTTRPEIQTISDQVA